MFAEIHQSLTAALATGKIGTPVSVRVHLQLSDRDADLESALESIINMTAPALTTRLKTLQSRVHADGHQWNLLLQTDDGRTLIVTLGRGSAVKTSLELLVVGNHGVIRLEGGEILIDAVGESAATAVARDSADRWNEIVRRSHQDGVRVSLDT